MNVLRFLLFLNLWLLAFIGNAQDFKVIEETKDYILTECDRAFYYSYGLPPKDDFVLDKNHYKVMFDDTLYYIKIGRAHV